MKTPLSKDILDDFRAHRMDFLDYVRKTQIF